MNYHYIAHLLSAVVIVWLVSIMNHEQKEETVSKAIYEAIKQDSARLANERDSIARINLVLADSVESLENMKPKYIYIHKNRNNEIELFNSSELHDDLQREIAGLQH